MSNFFSTVEPDECEMCAAVETDKKPIKECPNCEDMYCPTHIKTDDHGCYAVVE